MDSSIWVHLAYGLVGALLGSALGLILIRIIRGTYER